MFYAALVKSSYHVPGDERSRTNPGHGYPAHDVEYTNVVEFKNYQEMTEWVVKQEKHHTKYRLVECHPLTITIKKSVSLLPEFPETTVLHSFPNQTIIKSYIDEVCKNDIYNTKLMRECSTYLANGIINTACDKAREAGYYLLAQAIMYHYGT